MATEALFHEPPPRTGRRIRRPGGRGPRVLGPEQRDRELALAGHPIERGKEILPGFALLHEYFLSRGSELVKTSTALSGLLDPAPLNETALLQPIEQRVERSDVKLQHSFGTPFD